MVSWQSYIKGFKSYLQLEKSLSGHSVEAYLRDVDKLVRYLDLMDHWRSVLPAGVMTTVAYVDVVQGAEGEVRRLLEFLGLAWDAGCLDFHASSRPVKTASVAQVRKPLYTSSLERWRKYGAGLQPLIDALEPTRGRPGGLVG